jgi:hypothetical protein
MGATKAAIQRGDPMAPVRPTAFVVLIALAQPALAGPPYVSDDPEPTEYKHYEIYTFNNGTGTRDGLSSEAGIDFNYGAAPNLQLTATLPLGFESPRVGATRTGLSNIEIAAKYRFLRQDAFGWDVSVFPRIFLPSPSTGVGESHASLLLPVWVQRDLAGGWSTFGGGGCVLSANSAQNFCLAGWVVTRQIVPKLQLGMELFHQTGDASGTPASSSLGVGLTYDLNDNYHLLGYVRRGIQNANQTDQYSWYAALLTTF